jgi:mannose-6-phosphate isomerase-like protein (cupin superfamily)
MHITATEALVKLAETNKRFAEVFAHGTLSAEIYKPVEKDEQQPHDRDEMYVIISGDGDFYLSGTTIRFGPGDFLFVPAGAEHRFENFGEDFATWVFFYGPVGGEKQENK